MKDEDLRDAFRALRETTGGDSPDADDTLERVLASSRVSKRRRLRLLKVWIPLAAALVGSSAWAAANGKLDSLWTATSEEAPPRPTAPDSWAPPRNDAATVTITVPSSYEVPQVDAPTDAASPTTPSEASAPSAARSSAPVREPLAKEKALSKENPLARDKADFESAYRVHANAPASDPAAARAAVAAWNQYLSQHPRGRFVPEATYARAVALARAGQRSEAQEALKSFAEGEPGSYRRDDALELLEKIEK